MSDFNRHIPKDVLGEKSKMINIDDKKIITKDNKVSLVKARKKYPSEIDRKSTKIYLSDWEKVREEYKKTDIPMIQIISEALELYFKTKEK